MATNVLSKCNLREAGCDLELAVADNRAVSVQPDRNDPYSRGYVCPKGMAIVDASATA